jgi:hypothetical protein
MPEQTIKPSVSILLEKCLQTGCITGSMGGTEATTGICMSDLHNTGPAPGRDRSGFFVCPCVSYGLDSLTGPIRWIRKILTRRYSIYRLYFRGYFVYVSGWHNIASRPKKCFWRCKIYDYPRIETHRTWYGGGFLFSCPAVCPYISFFKTAGTFYKKRNITGQYQKAGPGKGREKKGF